MGGIMSHQRAIHTHSVDRSWIRTHTNRWIVSKRLPCVYCGLHITQLQNYQPNITHSKSPPSFFVFWMDVHWALQCTSSNLVPSSSFCEFTHRIMWQSAAESSTKIKNMLKFFFSVFIVKYLGQIWNSISGVTSGALANGLRDPCPFTKSPQQQFNTTFDGRKFLNRFWWKWWHFQI